MVIVSLLFLFSFTCLSQQQQVKNSVKYLETIIRFDTTQKNIYLFFSADEHIEGGRYVYEILKEHNVKASFFFTGNFYKKKNNAKLIKDLLKDRHYLGAHSDKHLLYASWTNRDSTLITKREFIEDIKRNYEKMKNFGIKKSDATFFLPPYEWWNKEIAEWCKEIGLKLVNFTPGIGTNRDYTTPEMEKKYADNQTIFNDLMKWEREKSLNGCIILIHPGTDYRRKEKFYFMLDRIIKELKAKGYNFKKL